MSDVDDSAAQELHSEPWLYTVAQNCINEACRSSQERTCWQRRMLVADAQMTCS